MLTSCRMSGRDSKDGSGIQDEQSECLSPSRGREYLGFYERSVVKYLVTRDRIPHSPPNETSACVSKPDTRAEGTGEGKKRRRFATNSEDASTAKRADLSQTVGFRSDFFIRKPDVFSIGKEVTGGLVQVLDQKDNLQKKFYILAKNGEFQSFNPKVVLIIDNLKKLNKKTG